MKVGSVSGGKITLNLLFRLDALSLWHKYNVIEYIVVIRGRLDTRVETRCPAVLSILCSTRRSRHFSYSEIEFYFQVLVKFSSYHAKKPLMVYLYINLLLQIITSL